MSNIWVRLEKIEWAESNETLPDSIDNFVIAPEWIDGEGDNYDIALSDAIDKRLEEIYGICGHCICFAEYDEKTAEKLDLQYLLNACTK